MRRPRIPATNAAVVFAVLCGLAVVIWMIVMIVAGAAERDELRQDVRALTQTVDVANQRLIKAGEKPVTPPEPGEPGAAGQPGAEGRPPTSSEIGDAVSAFCADNACRGPAGSSVTPRQVAQAVSTYCNDRGECRGARGSSGRNGADGNDGAAGPPPTPAQIADAVAAFCADGRCRGPAGPPGATGQTGSTGATGSDGRGLASINCNSTPQLEFTVTYTDGTQETVSCTAVGSQG